MAENYAPTVKKTKTYKGTSYGFSVTIKEDGSPLDLSTLHKVQMKMFSNSGEIFDYDTDGQLSLSGDSNQTVSGVADPDTMDIGKRPYYQELWLHFSETKKDVYFVLHNTIIDAKSGENQGAHDWVIDIDTSAETVTGQPTAVLAQAIEAKDDAESAESNVQTIADNFDGDFDITNLQAGDILRAEDVNGDIKLVRKSEEDFLSPKNPLLKSAVGARINIYNYLAWDNFVRDSLGDSDNGLTWNSGASTHEIHAEGFVQPTEDNTDTLNYLTLPARSGESRSRDSLEVKVYSSNNNSTDSRTGVIAGIDTDNHIRLTQDQNDLLLESIVSGTPSELLRTDKDLDAENNRFALNDLRLQLRIDRFSDTFTLIIISDDLGVHESYDADALFSEYSANDSIQIAGVYSNANPSNRVVLSSFTVRSLRG